MTHLKEEERQKINLANKSIIQVSANVYQLFPKPTLMSRALLDRGVRHLFSDTEGNLAGLMCGQWVRLY